MMLLMLHMRIVPASVETLALGDFVSSIAAHFTHIVIATLVAHGESGEGGRTIRIDLQKDGVAVLRN